MEKPFEYFAIHKETKEIKYLCYMELRRYSDPDIWQIYIDTRYKAKLRLWRYIHKIKPYRPFEGTEIGKSLPILNF